MEFIIGTRGSKLALVQSEYVKKRLEDRYKEHRFSLKIIQTKGDLVADRPLNQIGGKGLFVKEIEEQILRGQVHIGVHSMKDMPPVPADGLVFTKCWEREDPRDVLVLRSCKSLRELPKGAVIGTGSMRRKCQLLKLRPDLKIVDIRGNVDTRLRKMEEQGMDGIVLAAAGLHRLKREAVITQYLEETEMISAPAQGILALEIREDAVELGGMLDALYDEAAEQAARVEREFLKRMGGNCHVPVGAYYERSQEGRHRLRCIFGDETGKRVVQTIVSGEDADALAKDAASKIRKQLAGKVYLVGGGPGDPGLITVKGAALIREADCIIYDRLSSPYLLNGAKNGCEMIYVGKENHNHTMKQDDINRLLVEKALSYEKVVRLKGGDVYVFGRGGEEGSYLRENGIMFEVVPGISSSVAGLSYAGIPVTHRGFSSGFHVVTAHDKRDELADIDFKAMASGRDTCVFLMGLTKLREIADGLLAAGMDENMPAAVISNATTSAQCTVVADLAHIAQETVRAGLTSPALIVVGQVVSLREKLNFFEEKPLFGKRYLIPKIGSSALSLTKKLEDAGAAVTEVPVGNIKHLKVEITKESLADADWLVFTSKNGVEAFFENLFRSGLDVRALGHVKTAVIGQRTAERLKAYGVAADLMPEFFDGDTLRASLSDVLCGTEVIWYLKAANAHDDFRQYMEDKVRKGGKFVELPVYENRPLENLKIEAEDLSAYDGVCFTCASSAKRLLAHIPDEIKTHWMEKGAVYSIGTKTSEALERCKIDRFSEAKEATYEGLAELVLASAIY